MKTNSKSQIPNSRKNDARCWMFDTGIPDTGCKCYWMLDATLKESTMNNAGSDSYRGKPGKKMHTVNQPSVAECALKIKFTFGRNVQTGNT